MIVQKIIRYTPPPPVHHVGGVWPIPAKTMTQEELNNIIANSNVKLGMFGSFYNLDATGNSLSLSRLNFVVAIQDNPALVEYSSAGQPRLYKLMALGASEFATTDSIPWMRWDDGHGFSQIPATAYDRLINDNVQNYIKKHYAQHPPFIR